MNIIMTAHAAQKDMSTRGAVATTIITTVSYTHLDVYKRQQVKVNIFRARQTVKQRFQQFDRYGL